jgi:hypothetical protein
VRGLLSPATVAAMSHILFGLALISASLQTAWALFAEEQLLGLPVMAVMFYVGWHNVKGGADHLQNQRGLTGAAESHQSVNSQSSPGQPRPIPHVSSSAPTSCTTASRP